MRCTHLLYARQGLRLAISVQAATPGRNLSLYGCRQAAQVPTSVEQLHYIQAQHPQVEDWGPGSPAASPGDQGET